jgi:hypothetical protein
MILVQPQGCAPPGTNVVARNRAAQHSTGGRAGRRTDGQDRNGSCIAAGKATRGGLFENIRRMKKLDEKVEVLATH